MAKAAGGLTPRNDVALVDFGDQAVLFCEGQQLLYAQDPVSATLWSILSDGATEDEAVRILLQETSLSPAEAEDYIASCLARWDELGLLSGLESSARAPVSPVETTPTEEPQDDVFGFSGFRVGIRYCDPEVATAVRDVFGHLRVEDATCDFAFITARPDKAYRLLGPDAADHVLADPAAVAVWLKTEILDALLRRSPGTIAIHAAALESPKGTVLLVGPSGCGKTTIAAFLNAHGWPSIADDVVLIDCRPAGIRGLPLAYAVKPGSWPVIARARPLLNELQAHRRPDARIVKYLPPASTVVDPNSTAVAIVFPRFSERVSSMMSPVARADALARMLGEARNASEYLTTESFLAVATIVGQAAVHELRFGDAEKASAMLRQQAKSRRDADGASFRESGFSRSLPMEEPCR